MIPTRIRSRYRLLASVANSVAVEASPQAIAPILLSYGPEGECWKTSDLQVLDICRRACDAGREALEPLAPDFGACGECTEDLHCDDSDQPRCETDENVCVECISDGDCNGTVIGFPGTAISRARFLHGRNRCR